MCLDAGSRAQTSPSFIACICSVKSPMLQHHYTFTATLSSLTYLVFYISLTLNAHPCSRVAGGVSPPRCPVVGFAPHALSAADALHCQHLKISRALTPNQTLWTTSDRPPAEPIPTFCLLTLSQLQYPSCRPNYRGQPRQERTGPNYVMRNRLSRFV